MVTHTHTLYNKIITLIGFCFCNLYYLNKYPLKEPPVAVLWMERCIKVAHWVVRKTIPPLEELLLQKTVKENAKKMINASFLFGIVIELKITNTHVG